MAVTSTLGISTIGTTSVTLNNLFPAIPRIAANLAVQDLRSITYLSTYPSIRMLGATPGPINLDRFHQIATMAYGWMPRVVRIDPAYTNSALAVLNVAKTAEAPTLSTPQINNLATCLHSLVGASKILHFINDSAYPIWDSNIEAFRLSGAAARHNHMKDVNAYLAYVQDVHAIRHDPGFPQFQANFMAVFNARLTALGIAPYPISSVRVIEAAAFELAR